MNQKRLYISYIFKYIILLLVLFLSLRYILPFKIDNNKTISILLINIVVMIMMDKYTINMKEIKYIDENREKEIINYRLLDN